MILSLSSCEKDDSFKDQAEDSQINATESGFYTEYVESPAISKNANLTKQLSKSLTTPENVMGKGERTELTLHTQIAKYISSEDGSYHSYTFHVSNTPEGEGLENVLYASSDGGKSYRIYLLEYPYTEEKMINSFLPFKPLDFKGEHIAYYPLNEESKTNTVDCIMVIQGYCAGKQNHTDGLLHGYPCPANQTISSYLDCSITSSGGDGETTSPGIPYNPYPFNDSSPDGSSSGDGGIGNPSSGTDVTSPLYLPMKSVIRKLAPYEDEAEEDHIKQCLSDNSMLTIPLEMFLGENPTPEQEAFGKEAIKAKCENSDAEVDFEDRVILHPTFKNNQKAKCVYDKLKGLSSTIFNDIVNDNFGSSKKSQVTFKIATTPNGEDAFTKGRTNGGISRYDILLDPLVVSNSSTIEIALILIHESIHAELMDRCVRLGIINAFDSNGNPNFTNTSNMYNTYDALFALLVNQYKNYGGNNSEWNHDMFTVLNHRIKMAQNLEQIHPWLNDGSNDFLTNVNNDNLNIYGDFTIEELMDYISWIGLEGTQEYINTILNNPLEETKKSYVENAARTEYTNNCN